MIIENNFHSLIFQDHLNGEGSPTIALTSVLSRSYSAQHVVGHSEESCQKGVQVLNEVKKKDKDLFAMETSSPCHVPFPLEHFLLLMIVCVVSLRNKFVLFYSSNV